MQPGNSTSRPRRNEIERGRRIQMKNHFSRLASLLPTQERLALPALLDQSISNINQLKEKIEELKKRREQLQGDGDAIEDQRDGLISPLLAIREVGSALEINLITGVNQRCMLNEIFRVLQEEGAEVVSASCSTVGSRRFYSVYSQALCSRIGVETSRISERLQMWVHPVA
ncbi:unnamed protein product [Ilex paraguariensis]|uniref:BHLH domain-containing protein n=1 Tax=Ilex paraguariensis TaxID=185542 RepID=A0ABC8UNU8_9AQUA